MILCVTACASYEKYTFYKTFTVAFHWKDSRISVAQLIVVVAKKTCLWHMPVRLTVLYAHIIHPSLLQPMTEKVKTKSRTKNRTEDDRLWRYCVQLRTEQRGRCTRTRTSQSARALDAHTANSNVSAQ